MTGQTTIHLFPNQLLKGYVILIGKNGCPVLEI
jgi:hypothetical protein